jgi:hypothetical protein
MFATLFLAGVFAQSADDLVLIRYELADPGKKAGLFVLDVGAGNAAAHASDTTFVPVGGPRPASTIFGIDLDGDRADELAVIREQVAGKGRYTLTFHRPPDALFSDASPPIAKPMPGALGTRAAFGRIVDADGIDVDGDLHDELMIVRRVESGLQRLEVFAAPKPGAGLTPIASYLDLGHAPHDEVLHAVAVDVDADAKEEIALVRRDLAGVVRVDVIAPPAQPGAVFAGALSSGVLSQGGADPVAIDPIRDVDASDLNDDGIDELFVLRQFLGALPAAIGFGDRIDVHSLPIGGVAPIVAPSISVVSSVDAIYPIREVVVLRGDGAKPNLDGDTVALADLLAGEYAMSIQVATSFGGYAGGGTVTVGPITDFRGEFVPATQTFRLESPSVGDVSGVLLALAGSIQLADDDLQAANPFAPSDLLSLHVKNLKVHKVGSKVAITGDVGGTIVTPFSTLTIVAGSIFGLSQ